MKQNRVYYEDKTNNQLWKRDTEWNSRVRCERVTREWEREWVHIYGELTKKINKESWK
jgi:hypothetical protein